MPIPGATPASTEPGATSSSTPRAATGATPGDTPGPATGATPAPASLPSPAASQANRPAPREIRQRGYFEIRWRQFRRAPRPVVRAVVSSLAAAGVLGIGFLVYDIALDKGAQLPGGDLRLAYLALYVVIVCVLGAVLTYLFVPLPSGAGSNTRVTRTPWSLALGLFAAVPIAYIVLVVLHEILKPLLVGG